MKDSNAAQKMISTKKMEVKIDEQARCPNLTRQKAAERLLASALAPAFSTFGFASLALLFHDGGLAAKLRRNMLAERRGHEGASFALLSAHKMFGPLEAWICRRFHHRFLHELQPPEKQLNAFALTKINPINSAQKLNRP